MTTPSRRRVLRAGAVLLGGSLGGCLGSIDGPGGSPGTATGTPVDAATLTSWERSTSCDRMHDSVIRVVRVSEPSEVDRAINFADLSEGEKEILRTVTREGGYGTCEKSEAFERFLDRVRDFQDRRNTDRYGVDFERDGVYYGLSVESLDQVYG